MRLQYTLLRRLNWVLALVESSISLRRCPLVEANSEILLGLYDTGRDTGATFTEGCPCCGKSRKYKTSLNLLVRQWIGSGGKVQDNKAASIGSGSVPSYSEARHSKTPNAANIVPEGIFAL